MGLKHIFKKQRKLLFGIFVFIFALNIGLSSNMVKAAPDVKMEDGKIVFTVSSKAASTNIRYRTIGFTLSMKEQLNEVTAKGISGPDSVPNPSKELPLLENEKIELSRTEDEVITQYRVSEERVKDALKELVDLDNLSANTPIYLNAIFETYQVVGDKEIILNQKITTWKGIVNAHGWANITDFKEYFNIKVDFKPGLQDNTLHYELNGIKQFSTDLESKSINETLRWNRDVTSPTIISNTQCKLIGCYVKSKLTGKELPGSRKMVGDIENGRSITANDIINGSATVLYGGLDVHMIYEPSGINIAIDARDIDTDENLLLDMYNGIVEPGQNFEQAIDNTIIVDGVTYTKTVHFYYLYNDSGNNLKKVYVESDRESDPVRFQIPTDIKTSVKIIVKVYYKKSPPGNIPITIKAVDKYSGDTLKTFPTSTIAAGTDYTYMVSDEPISLAGKTYSFTGEWKWEYQKNTSSSPIVSTTGSGGEVSFKVPSADDIKDGITVNVYYKTGGSDADAITLRVIMVSKSGGFVSEISTETVTRRQAISKPIKDIIFVNGYKYHYLDKWDYKYMTSSGENTRTGSGSPASFEIPASTNLGSVINLRIYYEIGEYDIFIPPKDDDIVLPIDTTNPQGIINADIFKASYFTSEDGIPTTESQYVYVKTKDYLLGYRLVNKVGTIKFIVPVTMTYTLKYYSATPVGFGGPKEVTDTVTDTQLIEVERGYSYWEIENLEYYLPSYANVYNYSLPNEGVHLTANGAYLNVPSLSTSHSSNKEAHIIYPKEKTEGIKLEWEEPITSPNDDRPMVEFIDLTPYAYEMTGELKVKNDYLLFNGIPIMRDNPMEIMAPTPNVSSLKHSNKIVHEKVFYTDGQVVDALKKNGVYSSNGNVTYAKHPMSVNAYADTKYFNMPVNDVTIHTPVICDPIISSDNDKYVQALYPTEGAHHLVLDPDTTLNDFTIRISNTLHHSNRLGYYERDFSKSFIDSNNISYIAKKDGVLRNEMKLPFDVYLDTDNDKDTSNDEYIKAGNWITLGTKTHRFYVPMWVKEGTYTAEFRSIAVNGESRLDNKETIRNTSLYNYVATSTKTFQVSGRMYGLTLYDISDEGNWDEVFRVDRSSQFKFFEGYQDGTKQLKYNKDYAYYYKVGTKDQYGNNTGIRDRFTFPMMNGSHPQWKNIGVTKTGYAIRFRLDTIGEMYASGNRIAIKPTFYHVDADGKNRQLVDIYYDEEFNGKNNVIVKVGEGADLANYHDGYTGNIYSKIPDAEIQNTAKVMGTTASKIKGQHAYMYRYGDVRLEREFRTFIGTNYAASIANHQSFDEVKAHRKETETSLSKYMQRWYGTYKLPSNIHAVPTGYDVYDHLKKHGINYQEDFWLKDGYIIVNFTIESYDMNGNRNLSYSNGYNYLYNNHCSMWVTEGGAVEKTDNTGAKFSVYVGDIMYYYTSKKHSDDYIGRIY